MARKRSHGRDDSGPMTAEALLRMDNIPASAPTPEEVRRDLAERPMVITSTREDFDPRQHLAHGSSPSNTVAAIRAPRALPSLDRRERSKTMIRMETRWKLSITATPQTEIQEGRCSATGRKGLT